jgi:hypothetical protein
VYPFSDFARDTSVNTELTKVVAALGIQRSMVYHGINEPETFEPVGSLAGSGLGIPVRYLICQALRRVCLCK